MAARVPPVIFIVEVAVPTASHPRLSPIDHLGHREAVAVLIER
jgi:hypothetical protein